MSTIVFVVGGRETGLRAAAGCFGEVGKSAAEGWLAAEEGGLAAVEGVVVAVVVAP
jgi:hypothetical protein